MARGARRPKSPFRAALEPLYRLDLRWRPGRTGMGTLTDIDRKERLLDEQRDMDGLELCAVASKLYQEGDPHGYRELCEALGYMQQRIKDLSLYAAVWKLLLASGWVGDFSHCWHCGDEVEDSLPMNWEQGQLLCHACGNGMPVSAGMRKAVATYLVQNTVRLGPDELSRWRRMVQDVLGQHGVRPLTSAAD